MAAKLPFQVHCKHGSARFATWETIAAFDCLPAARSYAEECYKTNVHYSYRVHVSGRKVQPILVWLRDTVNAS